uniref:Uncharacterized protein n=1 Tax=Brassica oleracea TaxID=3712 RepID=A0A3P6FJ62_BRAOL|nr:unnamed protein product [Brassica oleracea]
MDKKPFSVLFSPIPQQRLDDLTLSPPVVSHQHRKPSDEFLRAVDQDIADFTINIIAKPLTMALLGEGLNVPRCDSVSSRFS